MEIFTMSIQRLIHRQSSGEIARIKKSTEIKHAFLGFLSYDNGTYYPLKNLQINNGTKYSYGEIIKEDFDLTKFENMNQVTIGYDISNDYYNPSMTFRDTRNTINTLNPSIKNR